MTRRIILAALVGVLVSGLAAVGSSSVGLADYKNGVAAYLRGDYVTALKEFRVLAEQGVEDAQFNLGVMYRKGQGVIQDYVQAHMWFNIAAANGYEDAKKGRNLAEKSMTATDISRAQKLAKEWMEKHQK